MPIELTTASDNILTGIRSSLQTPSLSAPRFVQGITISGNVSGNGLRTSFGSGSAAGDYSFAEGFNTIASGQASHAEGSGTTASGNYSHAEGFQTIASDLYCHAEGYQTTASSDYSHAEGSATTASGIGSHAEGLDTTASGIGSHAEGSATTASGIGSHAEGSATIASATGSHAEGDTTTASGDYSHAEGFLTTASGNYSHAEGFQTIASGFASRAAGYRASAAQDYTYAWSDSNLGTNTTSTSTTRSGQYMVSASGGMFVPGTVGIGTDSTDNALTVAGNISATDTLYVGSRLINQNSIGSWNNISNVNSILRSGSANWNSVYSTVYSTSADYVIRGGNSFSSKMLIGTNDNNPVSIETGGIERLVITTTGDVSATSFAAPTARLTVSPGTIVAGQALTTSTAGLVVNINGTIYRIPLL